jgi:hypothetical protein
MNFLKWFFEQENAQGVGTLKFGENNRLVLEVDPGIGEYRKLIPKYKAKQPPMHPTHITVVRTGVETVDPALWEEAKAKYDGENFPFEYERKIKEGPTYWRLDVYSEDLERIRQELGLTPHRPGYDNFHITIANKKPTPPTI